MYGYDFNKDHKENNFMSETILNADFFLPGI